MAPTYTASSKEIAVRGSILKVKGRVNATDIVIVIPGTAPKKMPIDTPTKIANTFLMVKK